MSRPQPLSPLQRLALEETLQRRMVSLVQHSGNPIDNLTQAQHAYQTLQQDMDDAPQRSGDKEVEAAVADIDNRDFSAVSQALLRIHSADYGQCVDCHKPIAFKRLQLEPQTLRCIRCETLHERTP